MLSLSPRVTSNPNAVLGKLNAFLNEVEVQINKSIDPDAAQNLIIVAKHLIQRLSFQNSLPITTKLYLSNETPCDNKVNIHLPTGEVVNTTLKGNWTVLLTPSAIPDIVSVTILHLEYIGTPIIVNGINSGALYFSNDDSHPSVGTLDLKTGKFDIVGKILVRSSYADFLGVSPVALEMTASGTFCLVASPNGVVKLNYTCDIPSAVPFVGGSNSTGYCSSTGYSEETPDTTCPPGWFDSPCYGEDVDGDGEDDDGYHLQEIQTDEQGNRTEKWATPYTFRLRYVPKNGTGGWIGACKTIIGGTNESYDSGVYVDENGNTKGTFSSVTWLNEGLGGITTRYYYDPVTNTLTITKHPSLDNARSGVNPIGSPVTVSPPPTDPNDPVLDPPYNPVLSRAYPSTYILAISSGSPTWEYRIDTPGYPYIFKPGDVIGIIGVGITSASVNNEAKQDEFGAWRVKEITDKSVIFEATKEATVRSSVAGFFITAPNTIEGAVRWFTSYNRGITLGPVGIK